MIAWARRMGFSLSQAIIKRSALQQHSRRQRLSWLGELSIVQLHTQKIGALVLDFDGVLAAHGAMDPDPEAMALLKKLETSYQGKIYILSNKPNKQRQEFFLENFSRIKFIRAPRKKPYPDGLRIIAQHSKVPAADIAIIDDRILTGGLSSLLAGSRFIYLHPAVSNFKARPVVESFFLILRKFERLIWG